MVGVWYWGERSCEGVCVRRVELGGWGALLLERCWPVIRDEPE